jgi:hypothetical protein
MEQPQEQPQHSDPALHSGRRLPGELQYWINTWNNVHASPHTLFHYTDSIGLSGILRTQELWATHVYYVNDTQEFRYARALILDVIKERISKADQAQSAELSKLLTSFSEHAQIMESLWDPYIVCFCESDSLLSQWRAYAGQGQGFAIGFSPDRLKSRLAELATATTSAKLFKVIYEPKEQRQFVHLAIDTILEAFRNHSAQDVLDWHPMVFSEMAFSFKHPAFKEELEWRVVFMPRDANEVDVRTSGGKLVPYAKIPICESGKNPPYTSIVHGPTLDSAQTTRALKMLLGKAHPEFWENIPITGATAPLRAR